MSQVAAVHPTVEPAESPLTPESWGKLGMWAFLIGDAVGFGDAPRRLRSCSRYQCGLAHPLRGAGHQPHGGHDVLAHLLERDNGQGA